MTTVLLEDVGETVRLAMTPELARDIEDWHIRKCQTHPDTTWRRLITSNGATQIRRQCCTCGYLLGGPRKKVPEDDGLPLVVDGAYDMYETARERELNDIRQVHARKQFERDNSWFRDYDDYLKSEAWKAKRRLIFARSGGKCEGCGIASATQVHHLTYAHAKQEFLFELVAVCDACHDRLHGDRQANANGEAEVDTSWGEHPCNGCRFTSDSDGQPWCFIADEPVKIALAIGGNCGPDRSLFEHLK
ncbi:HNH endonuclease [Pararhizobium antarcticum]|uniref:HNH endonuclease n=1 Tax=Pararhizobium antarcticum TaxID=1798805 RepID=A0A657LWC9_9HYPH|nr:hypothetical protein [Pararhizobium antarcticum]OJF99976.1 hypothetical protein AX760_11365 [Pararhizobium antarcticum]